jgi:3-hydroxyisobutyrate dehydrogenase-like beta-hydroxyacid dehydrogenase
VDGAKVIAGTVLSVVGILHPGEMGAAVGAALPAAWWASAGRSEATAERARQAGMRDAGTVAQLLDRCAVVLSICPPHAAVAVAEQAAGFGGFYVDANAIAPATAERVAATVERYVDGGIIGAPSAPRLYLSGAGAETVAERFAGTPVEARVLDGPPFAASALKMAYAAWTKGSAALLLTALEAARRLGVEDALVAEWEHSQPELPARVRRAAESADAKGWRWVGEMEEIARTFAAAGLPDGFHRAAAQVYEQS